MASYVIDASAMLAFVKKEPGADFVAPRLVGSMASAVNIAEVGAKLSDFGLTPIRMRDTVIELGVRVVAFDEELALLSSGLRPKTREHNVSLADRACLALALRSGFPALTADRAWQKLDIGVDVELIR